MDLQAIKQAAKGRWSEILPELGIPAHALTGRHGPCPGCNGRDRFRFVGGDDGKWFCGQGGTTTGGDGFHLLVHTGMTTGEAFRSVDNYLGVENGDVRRCREWRSIFRDQNLDKLIFHECHILMQVAGNRMASRQLEKDVNFRQVRPDWHPMPVDIWGRELLAAKRLMRAFGERYGLL